MNSYCIFCKTGGEKDVAKFISILDQEIEAIVPMRVLQQKHKGKWKSVERPLFPGYIFLYGEDEVDFELLKRIPGIYKILDYHTSFKKLQGSDHDYALWIRRHQGSIEPSKVLAEDKKVKVVDGPLLDLVGTISRLDKHKRRVWVDIEFDGKKRTISLSAECVEIEEVDIA